MAKSEQRDLDAARQEAGALLQGCINHLRGDGMGQIPELFDGDAPHQPAADHPLAAPDRYGGSIRTQPAPRSVTGDALNASIGTQIA